MKHHKWFGLLFAFFMLMFCLSGIVLNHRPTFAQLNLSRKYLPEGYQFDRWNNGLLRGSLTYRTDSTTQVLLYGSEGFFLTDRQGIQPTPYNTGLAEGADFRQIKGAVQLPDGSLFAAAQFGLYRYDNRQWKAVALPLDEGERLTDLTQRGDTLVAVGRSALYVAEAPYTDFVRRELTAPADYTGKVSLFRTVWMLHSGELFGLAGKLLMDGVALVLIFLCLSGLVYWLLPYYIRRQKRRGKNAGRSKKWLGWMLQQHDKVGRYTIALLLFIAFTGWCLRPPVLLALAQGEIPALPGSSLDSPNAWHDKLRMLRYDAAHQDWLLSTSEGFYRLTDFDAVPEKLDSAPTISVMGQNVWAKDSLGRWLCGSFSGMYVWDREQQTVTDWFTHQPVTSCPGTPFGAQAISGYCEDLDGMPFAVDYDHGTCGLVMPEEFRYLPMSLWNLSLEIHTGRLYTFLGPGTLVFITFAGLIALWCLWTGWKVRLRRKDKKLGTDAKY